MDALTLAQQIVTVVEASGLDRDRVKIALRLTPELIDDRRFEKAESGSALDLLTSGDLPKLILE